MTNSRSSFDSKNPLLNRSQPDTPYIPPSSVVLAGLGITQFDLEHERVTVSAEYLRFLLGKIASLATVDPAYYRKRYPDVEGAKLANEISSYQAHFEQSGYIEGRLPHEVKFDPDWYYRAYHDLADVFEHGSTAALTEHFETVGRQEGRAGSAEDFEAAESWRLGRVKA
jgi:hypothetical protein